MPTFETERAWPMRAVRSWIEMALDFWSQRDGAEKMALIIMALMFLWLAIQELTGYG